MHIFGEVSIEDIVETDFNQHYKVCVVFQRCKMHCIAIDHNSALNIERLLDGTQIQKLSPNVSENNAK